MLRIKRIYEEAGAEDGYRILVDRLWPRGVSKERAALDYWAKEISPSSDLRKYFNHEMDRFEEFTGAYLYEISINKKSKEFLDLVIEKLRLGNVTLLYAAKDATINHVVVLKNWIEENI